MHFELNITDADSTSDLNYDSIGALSVPKDAAIQYWSEYSGEYVAGVDLALPTPGSVASLGSTKSIVIDNSAPRIKGVSSCTRSGVYGVSGVASVRESHTVV